jgi:HSP20 family molecular chaperone IbpA
LRLRADSDAGVLTVRLPKTERARKSARKVEVE